MERLTVQLRQAVDMHGYDRMVGPQCIRIYFLSSIKILHGFRQPSHFILSAHQQRQKPTGHRVKSGVSFQICAYTTPSGSDVPRQVLTQGLLVQSVAGGCLMLHGKGPARLLHLWRVCERSGKRAVLQLKDTARFDKQAIHQQLIPHFNQSAKLTWENNPHFCARDEILRNVLGKKRFRVMVIAHRIERHVMESCTRVELHG
mmetsp:Transcript_14913/g.24776  ORF Transcript_14913/g.24776 Transcript_14913/m.24776 type:complete len:202 (-) Transcript_14913:478-1083(-)